MGQVQATNDTVLEELDDLIDEKVIDEKPELIAEMLDNFNQNFATNHRGCANQFNERPRNWFNLSAILRKKNIQLNKNALTTLVNLLEHDESLQLLEDSLLSPDNELFKSLTQQLCFISLTPDTQTMHLISQCLFSLSLRDDWKGFLVDAGVLNSLVLLIQDPNKQDTKTIKANDIIQICLQCLLEYANFRDDNMKIEIIKNKGSTTLLQLVLKDINDIINELSLQILAALAENRMARDIIVEDKGLLITVNMYKKEKNKQIKKQTIRLIGNLALDISQVVQISRMGIVTDLINEALNEQNPYDQQQYILTLLTLSGDYGNYKKLVTQDFTSLLKSLNFEDNKEDHVDIKDKIFFIQQFCEYVVVFNYTEIYMALVDCLILTLGQYEKYKFEDNGGKINIKLIIYKMILDCIANITVFRDCQLLVAQPEILAIFIKQLNDFMAKGTKYIINRMEIVFYKKKKLQNIKQISEDVICMRENINYQILCIQMLGRILENVYINEENIFLLFHQQSQSYITVLNKLKLWADELQHIKEVKEIQDEVTLFLAMLPSPFSDRMEKEKLRYAMQKINSPSLHVSLKAAAVYNHIALDHEKRQFMIESKILDHLLLLLNHKVQPIKREIASAIYSILKQPQGMFLWMKFDTKRLQLDSSNCNDILVRGNPLTLPAGLGKFNNWGVFINEDDQFVVVGDGIKLPDLYSIMFWLLLPPPPQNDPNKPSFRILFQGKRGKGGHVAIDPTLTQIGMFDEYTKNFIYFDFNLESLEQGWHLFVITVDVLKTICDLYVNGQLSSNPISCLCREPIKYIGNAKNFKSNFGCILDLRMYSHIISSLMIEEMYIVNNKSYEYDFPDNICDVIRVKKGIRIMLKALQSNYIEAQIMIFKCLIAMSSKQNCKIDMIKQGTFEEIIKYLNSDHIYLRYLVQKCILQLN